MGGTGVICPIADTEEAAADLLGGSKSFLDQLIREER